MRRALSEINRDVENLSHYNAHQLPLGLNYLVMQSAQDVFFRDGVIILHEPVVDADACHFLLIVTFKEESAFVGENLRFNQ